MRLITVKYNGNCAKCGASLEMGKQANYERSMGIFCIGCEPKDTEEIRQYRQERADIKADKYEAWAEKREQAATTQLNSNPEVRHDWAFITQPGHIPFRDRMNRADERAYESLDIARNMRAKAESLHNVQVKGDTERARQGQRNATLSWLKLGMSVSTSLYGIGTVQKINQKTATIKMGDFSCNVDLSWLKEVTA